MSKANRDCYSIVSFDVNSDQQCGGSAIGVLEDGLNDGFAPGSGGSALCVKKSAASPTCTAFLWSITQKCYRKKDTSAATSRLFDELLHQTHACRELWVHMGLMVVLHQDLRGWDTNPEPHRVRTALGWRIGMPHCRATGMQPPHLSLGLMWGAYT